MTYPNPLQSDALKNLNGVIIFFLDTEYRYTAFTDSHQKIMKLIWGADIAVGHSILEYIHREDDRKKAQHNFDRVLRGESLILEEEYGDDSGYSRSWWEARYSPINDAESNIVGVTVFVIDVTSRKQIEQVLLAASRAPHLSEEELASLGYSHCVARRPADR